MTEKLYTVAGTSVHDGETKVRWANDFVARSKVLQKRGDTDINLVSLPNPMTKLEALEYLQSLDTFNKPDQVYAITHKIHEKTKMVNKKTRQAKPTHSVSLADIRSRATIEV